MLRLLLGSLLSISALADLKVEDYRHQQSGNANVPSKMDPNALSGLQVSPQDQKLLLDLLQKTQQSTKETEKLLKELEKDM